MAAGALLGRFSEFYLWLLYSPLSDDAVCDVSVNVGQAIVPTSVTISELFVIKP